MAQITIEYDARNSSAKKMIEAILSLPFFKVKEKTEEIPYNEDFLNEVEKSFKGKRTTMKVADLWK